MARPTDFPEWATDGAADIVEPSEGEKELGWEDGNAPPASFFNYWQNLTYQWIRDLDYRAIGDILSNVEMDTAPTMTGVTAVDIHTAKPSALTTVQPNFSYVAACGPNGGDQVIAIRRGPGDWDEDSVTTAEGLVDVAVSKNPGQMIALAAGATGRWIRRNAITGVTHGGSTMAGLNPSVTQIVHDPVGDFFWAIAPEGTFQIETVTSIVWTAVEVTNVYTHILPLASGRVLFYRPSDNTIYYTDDNGATAFVAGAVLGADPSVDTRMVYDAVSDKVIVEQGDDISIVSGDGETLISTSTALADDVAHPFELRDRVCIANETSGNDFYGLCSYKTTEISSTPADWEQWPHVRLLQVGSPGSKLKIKGSYGGAVARASTGTGNVAIFGTRVSGLL